MTDAGGESDPELSPVPEEVEEVTEIVEGDSSTEVALQEEEQLERLAGAIARKTRKMEPRSVETSYKIEKWTGIGNFSLWSCQMSDKLTAKGQGRSLVDKKPVSMHEDDWEDLCLRACSEIRLHLSPEIQMQVLSYKKSYELWDFLEKRYLNKSSLSRLHAKTLLWSCEMKEGDDLSAHVQKFSSLACQIVALGDEPMKDEDKAFMLLRSLPKSLEHLLQTLIYGKDKLVYEDVQSALLSEDIRKMSFTSKSSGSPSALTVERGRGGERRGRPVARSKSKTRFRSKSRDGGDKKVAIKCWKCAKEGHVKRDCP